MLLLHHLNFSSIGTSLDDLLCAGVGIANARLDFELLRGGRVEVEEVGLVNRDSHGTIKKDEWGKTTLNYFMMSPPGMK